MNMPTKKPKIRHLHVFTLYMVQKNRILLLDFHVACSHSPRSTPSCRVILLTASQVRKPRQFLVSVTCSRHPPCVKDEPCVC